MSYDEIFLPSVIATRFESIACMRRKATFWTFLQIYRWITFARILSSLGISIYGFMNHFIVNLLISTILSTPPAKGRLAGRVVGVLFISVPSSQEKPENAPIRLSGSYWYQFQVPRRNLKTRLYDSMIILSDFSGAWQMQFTYLLTLRTDFGPPVS